MLLSVLSVLSFVYVCEASLSPHSILQNVRCDVNFCSSVKCENLKDCPPDHIVPNASYCNCCDACIPPIYEGEACGIELESSLTDIEKPKRCKRGLKCIDGTCTRENKRCIQEKTFRQTLTGGIFADDLWIPDCDEVGNYQPMQTKKKRSMCVNEEGKRIFGQQDVGSTTPMTCGCSRYMENHKLSASFMTEPQVHCTPTGDYDQVQCIGDLCYCADSVTGKAKGRIVKMKYMSELPCRKEEPWEKGYLKPCELEMIRNRKLVYEFQQKGINILLEDIVTCDPDGTFAPKQCDSTICVCTNTAGVGILGYFIGIENLNVLKAQMTCSCARDGEPHSNFPKLSCTPIGSNLPLHCFNTERCFCVDEDGDIISKELDQTAVSDSHCKEALQTLQDLELPITTTTLEISTGTDEGTDDGTDDGTDEGTDPTDYDYS